MEDFNLFGNNHVGLNKHERTINFNFFLYLPLELKHNVIFCFEFTTSIIKYFFVCFKDLSMERE